MADFARSSDSQVQAELDRLALLAPGRDVLGLERIRTLLDRLGNPQRAMPPAFHIAGTNGKGSTVAFLRAILEAQGYRVHTFTSPHLVRFNERIRLAGTLVDDVFLADLLRTIREASDGIATSFFEATTAAAFLAFSAIAADVCVIEVGLGGRLDATNVLEDVVTCGIAALGLDHQQFLGSTLADIAAEKAGIAKPGVPLVTMDYPEAAYLAISDAVGPIGQVWAPKGLSWDAHVDDDGLHVDDHLGSVTLPLPILAGAHQWENAALAVEMIRSQHRLPVSEGAMADGLRSAAWPARFQRLPDGPIAPVETWLDGAHNDNAAHALAAVLAERGPMHLVIGLLANKDADAIVGALKPHALSLTFVPVPDHEHHDPAGLAKRFGGTFAGDLAQALAPLPAPRLIAGSLYLAGAALSLNGSLPD